MKPVTDEWVEMFLKMRQFLCKTQVLVGFGCGSDKSFREWRKNNEFINRRICEALLKCC